MKKSRFSGQRIVFVLRQAEEGTPAARFYRKAEISEASFDAWRKKYGVKPSVRAPCSPAAGIALY
jgi:putative transposase